MTIIINFFGAPGSGKSTLAAGLFYKMKQDNYSVELVTEYAKEKVWENNLAVLEDQLYITAKQNRKLTRLIGKVEFIITDSPILLGAYYGKKYGTSPNIVIPFIHKLHHTYNNFNFVVTRTKEYISNGRLGSEEDSDIMSKELCLLLLGQRISNIVSQTTPDELLAKLRLHLGDICYE